jgi:hypothetical protein
MKPGTLAVRREVEEGRSADPCRKLDQSVNHPHKQFDGRAKTVPFLKRGTHLVDAQMGLNNETGF